MRDALSAPVLQSIPKARGRGTKPHYAEQVGPEVQSHELAANAATTISVPPVQIRNLILDPLWGVLGASARCGLPCDSTSRRRGLLPRTASTLVTCSRLLVHRRHRMWRRCHTTS